MDASELERALDVLGALLASRDSTCSIVVNGGGGLSILGLIARSTLDLDVFALATPDGLNSADPLPSELSEAARDVASLLGLSPAWLNHGPTALLRFGLPDGFESRLIARRYGALTVYFASRYDQIHFKLFAAADGALGEKHHVDLVALAPTHAELRTAAAWARTQDPSDGFLPGLERVLGALGVVGSR